MGGVGSGLCFVCFPLTLYPSNARCFPAVMWAMVPIETLTLVG